MIGSKGHEDTVAYIKGELEQFADYYTVETQAVPLNIGYNASLTANQKSIEAFAVTLAPGGNVTGPLVAIPNLGCEEVSICPSSPTFKTDSVVVGFPRDTQWIYCAHSAWNMLLWYQSSIRSRQRRSCSDCVE